MHSKITSPRTLDLCYHISERALMRHGHTQVVKTVSTHRCSPEPG